MDGEETAEAEMKGNFHRLRRGWVTDRYREQIGKLPYKFLRISQEFVRQKGIPAHPGPGIDYR